LQNSEILAIFGIYGIIFLKKIHRICPQHRGPGPPALAHVSTDFIKRRSLVTGSTAQIKPIKPVCRPFITDPTAEAAGSSRGRCQLVLPVARCGQARWLTGVRVFSSYSGRFSMRFFFLRDHNDEGNVFMLTLIGGERQRSPATVRSLNRCLSMVRAASGEASAPRTCAKASSSSLLVSRPTNCSDRRWKT
jgi:hypothetical protein